MFSEQIFKNEEVLYPEYLPELLPHRENQIKQLAENLLPASKGRIPQNTFLYGPPGLGKTVSVKFVFREFEDFGEIKTVYLNCWDYKTAHSILSRIAIELGAFVQRRGMSKDEILEKIFEVCEKSKKGLIVCLDEVDQLIFREQEALYDLLRINQYIKNPLGLVLISNNPNIFINLEPRIRSSLNIEEIEFKPYSLDEMKDILKERARPAFRSVEEGAILLASNHAVQLGGDVRIGLECLLKAGRLAERENSKKLRVEHIKKILHTVKSVKPEIIKERITEGERIILKIIEERRKLSSGELYEEYSKKVEAPVSKRKFRDFISHLAELKMIKIWKRKRGVRGKVRFILKA